MNFFDSKGIEYDVYSTDNPDVFNEMLKRNPSARTLPQIFIDDKVILKKIYIKNKLVNFVVK